MLCIIGHPAGQPKRVEAGPALAPQGPGRHDPRKGFDDVKIPALDKPPFSDAKHPGFDTPFDPRRFIHLGEGLARPFVLATPHHSMAWTGEMGPSAELEALRRLEQRGADALIFGAGRIPCETRLTIEHAAHRGWSGAALVDGRLVDLTCVRAGWWQPGGAVALRRAAHPPADQRRPGRGPHRGTRTG
jgi:hypothetical protein